MPRPCESIPHIPSQDSERSVKHYQQLHGGKVNTYSILQNTPMYTYVFYDMLNGIPERHPTY